MARVAFLDDGVVVCVDDVAPFECAYKPTGDDVGRNTLIAIAQDGAGQTGVDFRAVGVARFKPALTAATTPKRDKKRPYRYTTSGALVLPAGVTPEQACAGGGTVAVQFTAGKLKLPTTATLQARLLLQHLDRLPEPPGPRPRRTAVDQDELRGQPGAARREGEDAEGAGGLSRSPSTGSWRPAPGLQSE